MLYTTHRNWPCYLNCSYCTFGRSRKPATRRPPGSTETQHCPRRRLNAPLSGDLTPPLADQAHRQPLREDLKTSTSSGMCPPPDYPKAHFRPLIRTGVPKLRKQLVSSFLRDLKSVGKEVRQANCFLAPCAHAMLPDLRQQLCSQASGLASWLL